MKWIGAKSKIMSESLRKDKLEQITAIRFQRSTNVIVCVVLR